MKLRAFNPDTDFERIRGWITDERAHALWCANRFEYPLDRKNFLSVLAEMAQRTGDTPFVAELDGRRAAGFFCYSLNHDSGEGKLKFVIVDPEYRGKGTACEMLRLAVSHAFADADAECVSLIVFSANPRAKRCYEKVGFTGRETDSPAFTYREESWDRCRMVIERQTKMEELLQTPYWIIDILPKQVPKDSPGQYFAIEKHFRDEQMAVIRQKHAHVIMKLNCYRDIELDGEKNPDPARMIQALRERETSLIIGNSLILSEPDDTHMTIFNPDEELLSLVTALASAEGLFVWKPQDAGSIVQSLPE